MEIEDPDNSYRQTRESKQGALSGGENNGRCGCKDDTREAALMVYGLMSGWVNLEAGATSVRHPPASIATLNRPKVV